MRGIRQRNHGPLFFKAMEAAQDGRYTTSELYFHEVVFQNPLFLKYSRILTMAEAHMKAAVATAKPVSDSDKESPPKSPTLKEENAKHDLAQLDPLVDGENQPFLVELNQPIVADEAPAQTLPREDTILSKSEQPSVSQPSVSQPIEITLPVGKDLATFLEFLQLQQDVEYVYIACQTEKAHQLAMVYAQLNCVWQQLVCYLIAKLRAERRAALNNGEEVAGLTLIHHGTVEVSSPTGNPDWDIHMTEYGVDFGLDMFEETCMHYLINSSVNYCSLALRYAETLEKSSEVLHLKPKSPEELRADAREHARVVKRQRRIYQNVTDLCQLLVDGMWLYVDRAPEEYICRVLEKVLPPRVNNLAEVVAPSALHSEASSRQSSAIIEDEGDKMHVLTSLVETFRRVASRHDGGTFLGESRELQPYAPIVLPFKEMNLPVRVLIPSCEKVSLAQLAKFQSPAFREVWHNTKWMLPEYMSSGRGYPGSSTFLLCQALPQYYTEGEGDTVVFSQTPIPGRQAASNEVIDTIIEFMHNRKTSEDATQVAALKATKPTDIAEPKPNLTINLLKRSMRLLLLIDEMAICMKPVYVVMAQAQRLLGNRELSRAYAAAVVLQTACLRGPASMDRIRVQTAMQEIGLL